MIIASSVGSQTAEWPQRIPKLRKDIMKKREQKNRTDKLSKTEVIITLALICPLWLVFIEHDDIFMLFLLELSFMAVIGLMFWAMVIIALKIAELIQKIVERWMR